MDFFPERNLKKHLGWGEDMIHSLWPQSSLPALDGGTTVKEQEVSAALAPVPTMPVPKSYDVRQLH